MITTLTSIAPDSLFGFRRDLLSTPAPKFRDDCETLWRVWLYIENRLEKKAKHSEKRWGNYQNLKTKFMELYGIAKAKEENLIETKAEHSTQRPFYYIKCPDKRHNRVFKGLGYQALYFRAFLASSRKNHDI